MVVESTRDLLFDVFVGVVGEGVLFTEEGELRCQEKC